MAIFFISNGRFGQTSCSTRTCWRSQLCVSWLYLTTTKGLFSNPSLNATYLNSSSRRFLSPLYPVSPGRSSVQTSYNCPYIGVVVLLDPNRTLVRFVDPTSIHPPCFLLALLFLLRSYTTTIHVPATFVLQYHSPPCNKLIFSCGGLGIYLNI